MQPKDLVSNKNDFAVLGHQDNWANVYSLINYIRKSATHSMSEEDIRYLFPFFPARSLFKVCLTSTQANQQITGSYIETFISPDHLDAEHLHNNIKKIREAAICADKLRAPVATLGGFTSILLEGQIDLLPSELKTIFTTGNTLTAAFITNSVMNACEILKKDITQSTVLIIGATGDIGTACVKYFSGKAAKLILVARNKRKLTTLAKEVSQATCVLTDDLADNVSAADIVIAAASSSHIQLLNLRPGTLVVDAGYPKNLDSLCLDTTKVHLFHGGMGYVRGGIQFKPDYKALFYHFPSAKIVHGCILEAMVLAFEHKYYAYSQGRGAITLQKMTDIFCWAQNHGIIPAPFYNHQGLWSVQKYNYDEYS